MENQKLINYLNQLLSNSFIMYVKLHRYQWYVQGNQSFVLRSYVETSAVQTTEEITLIGERILAIEGKPLATMSMYLKQGTLTEANADDTIEEIIQQLIQDYMQLIDEMDKEGFLFALENLDKATHDVLSNIKTRFENELWKLRSFK